MTKETLTFHTQEQIESEIANFDFASSPSSTTLTPHELYLLRQSGYEPVQIVFGNVVYSMGVRGVFRTLVRAFNRGELFDYSQLNKDARLLARNRMVEEAKSMGADSVVGVRIDTKEFADFMEVVATGTAVRKVAEPNLSSAVAELSHPPEKTKPHFVPPLRSGVFAVVGQDSVEGGQVPLQSRERTVGPKSFGQISALVQTYRPSAGDISPYSYAGRHREARYIRRNSNLHHVSSEGCSRLLKRVL